MNKDKEMAILKMVYDTAHFKSVSNQESPDFVLQHHNLDTGFGVEITELYHSESHARLKNVSWYTDHLLNGVATFIGKMRRIFK
ncbi:hypothetical protein CWM47_16375 [Spirosoma pollinicola]|uniref:Uncharacterized protein n=1 Tax=Spirosoma pollinicola TaxID=2057025 RepID=A0A2K8Z095_9BACT|nr:hypothetical protein CWM47_16375 [Spirosoma pollinicola]